MERIILDANCGDDNKIVAFLCPAPDGANIKGTVQICHGMADYFGRYKEFIEYLNNDGWNVCGMDMMGHGATYEINKDRGMPLGYFGDCKDSAMCILKDEMALHKYALNYFGESGTQVLYGHSMGSFVARNIYITPEYNQAFDKYVFASTMGTNPAVGAGLLLSSIGMLFGLKSRPGKLLNKIAFGAYNKRIPNNKTDFDWVCSSDEVVAEYCADPLAGFLFTWKGFKDLFTLVKRMQSKEAYANAGNAPCLLAYAEDDPVTGYGDGAREVAENFRNVGKIVTTKNYGHYRHEVQNEPAVKNDYFRDIAEFISLP
ncbi:MAG: lysophospholipase [Saccharofermentans sp.]|nr:lysophospholipase [Saccharofermentans sp.]